MTTAHVIGAGLAGLAAALSLSAAGKRVVLHEASDHGGGRCRSFDDRVLERRIDNGNHLILGANRETFAYLGEVGALDRLRSPEACAYPFVELPGRGHWTVRPNRGRLPWWIFAPDRRAPGTSGWEHLAALCLAWAGEDATIADCFDTSSPFFRRFVEPLVVAIANTEATAAAGRPFWPMLRLIFAGGAPGAQGYVARDGLSDALVDPALATLAGRGAAIRFHARLRSLEGEGTHARRLVFADQAVALGPEDQVVVAVPPGVAAQLLPGLRAPVASRSILNLHYRLPAPVLLPGGSPYLGLIGGSLAQWVFQRGDVLSATVSAADAVIDAPAESLARRGWDDLARALDLPADLPPWQVIKERRATFAQTPAEIAVRPGPKTLWTNVFLAGDWTATWLPASIEGAIQSGRRAAALAASVHRAG